ncbi:PAS domain S-box protein [Longimicrobium sp.]|uniref:PAS domain S-box protein n=1 Tax=Longimicrobium sp. TaxID=2029185 RepID=UPI002BF4B0F8|nr:PAS domain S-box protein [Longimicrobium sp.]HSU12814.1 PAS domain S-box protein [Longimicrobium sp.]
MVEQGTSTPQAAPSHDDPAGRARSAARLAARALAVPVSFAYDHGTLHLDAGGKRIGEGARAVLARFCTRVTRAGGPVCVADLPKEDGAGPLKAIAAVPLPGGCIGVAATRARQWTPADRAALDDAAALVPTAEDASPIVEPAADAKPERESARPGYAVFRAMFESSASGMAVLDLGGRILRANRALARMLGVRPTRLSGRPLADFIPDEDDDAAALRIALNEGCVAGRDGEVRLVGRGGREAWVRVGLSVRRRGGQPVFALAMVDDVTDRRAAAEAERRRAAALELLRGVATAANRAATLDDVLRQVLGLICAHAGWAAGHVWVRADDGAFVSSGIWRAGKRYAALREATRALRLERGEGLPGRAVQAGAPVWVEDVADAPWFARHGTAHIRGAVAVPVRAEGQVAAVVEFFSERPERADPEMVGLLTNVGTQLGLVVERERIAARLRESRRELSTLLGNLPGVAYRCRNERRWTLEFVSEGSTALTGYTPGELVGSAGVAFGDLIVPADRQLVWNRVQAAVAAGRPFELEYRITTRGGEERWVAETGVAVCEPGRPTVLEGFITDVTQRRLAEAALRRSGDYFRALIETSGEVVAVGNADGTLRYVSPAVERVTGYAPREWMRMQALETVHPDDLAGVRERFGRLVREPGSTAEAEFRMRHRNGRYCVVEVVARNLLNDASVNGIVYNTRDVTARRESEEALRRRERHFRSLIENAHDIITVLEGDGDVRFASPSVERTLGYDRQELAGTYLFELVHPDDVPAVLEVFDRAIRAPGEPQWLEFRMRAADGSYRTLESIGTSLLHDPAVTGIVVNSRDVTERREAEEALLASQQQLLQAQKMDAVGRLAGGVAHDFNNLLTAIRGNAELLLFDIPPGDPRREDVEEIRKASDRAATLTRQLLAFSRRQVLQPRVLGLNGVVREMERMLRRLIGEDVELATRLDPELGQVRADPGQVEQVILNLAVNGRDAMPAGGRLTVETRNEELGEDLKRAYPYVVPGPYVLLAVSDTGQGMDAETRERAFEPFFTTKPAGRGTGLGLSTVYGIVKQSGGFIWIDSELGRGTTIRIYLPPVAEPATLTAEAAAPALAARGAGTVLLAEDEVTVRRLAVRVLSRAGYTVLEAADGEEALRVASAHSGRIDVLVTDVVMPRLGGRLLASRLREARAGVPVIYMSGYTEEAVQRHGVLDPGTGFLGKPFTAEQLLGAVASALGNGKD